MAKPNNNFPTEYQTTAYEKWYEKNVLSNNNKQWQSKYVLDTI